MDNLTKISDEMLAAIMLVPGDIAKHRETGEVAIILEVVSTETLEERFEDFFDDEEELTEFLKEYAGCPAFATGIIFDANNMPDDLVTPLTSLEYLPTYTFTDSLAKRAARAAEAAAEAATEDVAEGLVN